MKKSNQKKRVVSVCMATYNGENYIKEQVESILTQLDFCDELIVSDDQSTDHTVDILQSISDPRLKIFIHATPSVYTANFENALMKAKGDYIFLADQDDVWLPNKVSACVQALCEYDFVMHDAKIVNSNKDIITDSRNLKYHVKNGFIRNFIKTRYLGCCMAFRREVLDYCLPFPKNHNLALHDAWLALNSELFFQTFILEEQLILYRRHGNNVSSGGETKSSLSRIIKIRVYLFWCLLVRKLKRLRDRGL